MADNQIQNQDSQELARAQRLADEIRQATGIGLPQSKQVDADLLAGRTKPAGMLHSMQIDSANQSTSPAPKPSLAEALQGILPTPAVHNALPDSQTETKRYAPATPQEKKTENYREVIEEGSGLNVESTPISGVQMRSAEDVPSAVPKEAMIHTLKFDVQDLVKKKRVSMIRAVALESDKDANAQTINRPITPQQKASNVGVYVMSTLFFLLGAITIGAVLYAQSIQEQEQKAESAQLLAENSLVFYEHQQAFNITDLQPYEMKGGLAQLREKLTGTLGSFTLIQLVVRPYDKISGQYYDRYATLQDVVNIMKPHLPRALTNILHPEYMFAIHTTEESSPLILLVGDTYDTTLAGMLAWESSMPNDLAPFFPSRGATVAAGANEKFEDLSVDNIDARILRAPNKKVRIIYAILEKNVIAITNNIYTIKEAAARLHARTSNLRGTGI